MRTSGRDWNLRQKKKILSLVMVVTRPAHGVSPHPLPQALTRPPGTILSFNFKFTIVLKTMNKIP